MNLVKSSCQYSFQFGITWRSVQFQNFALAGRVRKAPVWILAGRAGKPVIWCE